jgi:peptidoglycan hydrolase-like protein with peptidoglycan-binding domain
VGNAVSLASANKHHLQRLVLVFQNGLFGPAVKRLQEHLGQLGDHAGTLDRDYGSQPERAVKEFQRRLGSCPTEKMTPKQAKPSSQPFARRFPAPQAG